MLGAGALPAGCLLSNKVDDVDDQRCDADDEASHRQYKDEHVPTSCGCPTALLPAGRRGRAFLNYYAWISSVL